MPQKKSITSKDHLISPLLLILLLLIGVTITVSSSQKNQNFHSNAATTNCTVDSSKLTTKSQEKQLLDAINQYRVQKGVAKLTIDTTLKQSAAWLSLDMLSHNRLDHTDSLGRTLDIRLANCGYDTSERFGENIAKDTTNANTIFNVWKNDAAHNQVMLDNRFNIVGIDMEVDSSGKTAYWTMDVGYVAPISSAPSDITPTLFCLGSCQITSSPTIDVSNSPSNSPNMTTTPSVTTPGNATPTSNPCNTNTKSLSNNKNHVHSNATISDFIRLILQFFISLINLLLQLIGGGTSTQPTPNPVITPCVSPTS